MTLHATAELTPGSVFQAKYEIVEKISRGGFGTVYKARQISTGQLVAIKCLHRRGFSEQEDIQEVARFQREVKFTAMLHHPNIVRLIDTGQTSDDLFYMAFEYIPGQTLRAVLSTEGRLDPLEAGFLMSEVLDALCYTHNIGIMHRDLKPSNIMIAPGGVRRHALVLDFGIGAFAEEEHGASALDSESECMGTPLYSAPEQLRGEPTSTRSDLYSWGLVFYECLTGRRAITGNTVTQVMREQNSSRPISLPPTLREHPVGALLQAVTVKDAENRRINAKELLQWLGRCDLSKLDINARTEALERTAQTRPLVGPQPHKKKNPAPTNSDHNARAAQQLLDSEYKQLTVVSCSIYIIPATAAKLSVGASDTLLAEQKAFCEKLARSHGGHTVDELHNRVMTFFGHPRAQHDSAVRAVRMAVKLRDEIRLRSAMLSCSQRASIEVKISVHTGLVTIRGQVNAPIFSGTTAGIAAELDTLAPTNGVVISAVTKRLVEQHFSFSESAQHQLSGQRTMGIFTVSNEVMNHSTLASPRHLSPFYDREFELARLSRHHDQAQRGHGQSALIVGRVGVGKSRLLHELRQSLGLLDNSWLECRCTPTSHGKPLYPIISMFERQLGYHLGTDPDEQRHQLEILIENLTVSCAGSPAERAPSSTPACDSEPVRDGVPREQTDTFIMNALVSLLIAMSAKRPFVVVFEDLQWADDHTIEFLARLLTEALSRPIQVIMTASPRFHAPWDLPELETMHLGSLSKESAGKMIEAIFANSPLPGDRIIQDLSELTNGVPLYIQEMSRAFLESERGSQAATSTLSMEDIEVPSTLRDALTEQLERAESFKPLAEIASVLGREFTLSDLAKLINLPTSQLERVMDYLITADLICRRQHVGGETYCFRDPLVHRVAYVSLPEAVRQRYHQQIAVTMSEQSGDPSSTHAEQLARHLAAAGRVERAMDYLRKSAHNALSDGAMTRSLACVTAAHRWLESVTDVRQRHAIELSFQSIVIPATAVTQGCTGTAFATTIKRSKQLLELVGENNRNAFSVWYGEYLLHVANGRYQQAEQMATFYLECARQRNDRQMVLIGHSLLGSSHFYAGRFPQARASLLRAINITTARDGRALRAFCGVDPNVYNNALLGLILATTENPDAAVLLLEQTLQRARDLQHHPSLIYALYCSIQVWQLLEANDRVNEFITQWLDVAREADGVALGYGEALSAVLDTDSDHDMPRGWDDHVARPIRTYHNIWLARNESSHAMHTLALSRLDDCLSRSFNNGEGCYKSVLYYHKAKCLVAAGFHEDAESCLRRAIYTARTQGARMLELRASVYLCQEFFAQGKPIDWCDELESLYGRINKRLGAPLFTESRAVLDKIRNGKQPIAADAELQSYQCVADNHSSRETPARPAVSIKNRIRQDSQVVQLVPDRESGYQV